MRELNDMGKVVYWKNKSDCSDYEWPPFAEREYRDNTPWPEVAEVRGHLLEQTLTQKQIKERYGWRDVNLRALIYGTGPYAGLAVSVRQSTPHRKYRTDLPEAEILQIREALLLENDVSPQAIADRHQITRVQLKQICDGKGPFAHFDRIWRGNKGRASLLPEDVHAIRADLENHDMRMVDIAAKWNISTTRLKSIQEGKHEFSEFEAIPRPGCGPRPRRK